MPGGSFFSFTASLQYRADRLPSSCQERPLISNAPSRSRAIRSRLTAEGSFGPRSVREKLPPHTLDADEAALVLDRLAKLLVDDSHLRSGRRFVVPDTSKAEEIARKFRLLGMEYEGSVHFEGRLQTRHCLAARPDRIPL